MTKTTKKTHPPDDFFPLRLKTQRLTLREFEETDLADVMAYNNRPEFYRFLPMPEQDETTTKAFIQQCITNQQQTPRRIFQLAIILQDQVIGAVNLRNIDPANKALEIGYSLNPEYWGNGYALEAVQEMLTFGFEKLAARRITATADIENEKSQRTLERLGFVREGKLRDFSNVRGAWKTHFLYAMIQADFEQRTHL